MLELNYRIDVYSFDALYLIYTKDFALLLMMYKVWSKFSCRRITKLWGEIFDFRKIQC